MLLLLAATYLYWSQVKNLEREDNEFLVNQIQNCRRLLQGRPTDKPLLVNEVQAETAASLIKYYIRILDDRGRILLETSGMTNLLPVVSFPVAVAVAEIPRRGTIREIAKDQICLLMSAKAKPDLESAGENTIQVALDVSEEEELTAGYQRKLLTVVVLGSLF
ncbi:MAG TPA: hypothetical protein VNX46_07480, partial [Candidatus Acidoferrum sp.]|nr:hypothetical protein [Candidatus Acidoferrum sp.]